MSEKLASTEVSSPRTPGRPFVGRVTELEELRAALDLTAARRGFLFLLSGEPGIGKTRLMHELAREAGERGWRVAAGRCWEEGGAPAYWPWIQAVRALGGDFERLAARPGESVDPQTVRFRLFNAVAEFLVDTAQARPLVVVLDDLHAADAASLVMLRFVSEAVADAPVLVVGSYREREARLHERPESFAELVRVATRVSLQGLSVDEVEAYFAGVTGGDAPRSPAARLHVLTGGNPFFLGEVVRLVAHDTLLDGGAALDPMGRVPEEVRTLLRRRIADLPQDAVEALRVAAVVGREFNFRVLERTCRVSVARLLDVLAEACDAGVITEDPAFPRRYAFVHELVRETLYDDLAAAQRLELHRMIGAVLEELYRNDLDPHLSEIAHHLALAAPVGDVSAAVGYLVRAGDRAASLLAYEEAGVHYERALGLLGRRRGGFHGTPLRASPAPRRCPLAGRRHARRAGRLRGGHRARSPPGRRRDARACSPRLRDRARRLPAVRPLRGGRDGDRAARGGARRASRARQPAPGAGARTPGRGDVLLQ
ncbi:MAG: AAA family ATPase [Thermoleophilaceae bacterium]|nr:AAA family ATPase [Thermoleophilaceae bacterium]